MQPIKTTNAMNPAPAKGIESFPTPVIDDVVIAEVVNAWKGDYQKLEYGTLWKDVSHAPNQGSFPEHKLVFQQPTSEDGQWIKRIWVNDRVNQDSYNYAIKYSAGSQQHPIYIRNYVVPRETYTPLPDGTPDPLFPIALLVDEEANRIEGELDSKYVSVTRVYETLPGPEVPTKRYNERGDLETVIVQTVPPFTPPDPDGLLVTGSQVVQEEMGKGVKTTSTVQDHSLLQIKEKKEGLLGETITTDDIVAPSTDPDELSQTVVSSVVEQFSATKARKRTTTASGPTSLAQKSKDGKLLGDVTSTQTVVAPSTNPDAVSSSVLSSEVKQVDSGKAVKTNITLNSTPILSGNQNEVGLLGNKQVKESIVPAGSAADALSQTVVSSVVEAIDSARSKKTTITSTGPNSLSGNQKKEGLLGEVIVTETIVAAGASADALSQTIISSEVEPIDSAKSKKTTVTSVGPISLTGAENKGGLLGNINVVESIVPSGTTPDNLSQTIVSSTITSIDSAKSKKTTVTSIGPTTLSGRRINQRGEIETVNESIVSANSSPDQDTVNTISSEIEPIDIAKSKKTTITVPARAVLAGGKASSGLLGRTSVTDSIVAYPASPDSLTWTGNSGIIESSVEPISSTKARKITTQSSAIKLTSNTLIESQLGLVKARVEKSIVEKDTEPTSNESALLNVVKDSINSLDQTKSERELVKVDEWPENVSVDYDEQLGIGIYYKETIVKPSEYLNPNYWTDLSNIDYKAIDKWKSLKKEIDINKVSQALLDQYYKIPTQVKIKLPDKLKSVVCYLANSYGEGTDFDIAQGVNTGSYNMSNSGSSKSSWSIGGDIYFEIENGFDGDVEGYKHVFFMQMQNGRIASSDSIISILNNFAQFGNRNSSGSSGSAGSGSGSVVTNLQATYRKWPYIKTKTENIVLITGGKSLSNSKSQSQTAGINGSASSIGEGKSYDVNVNASSILVPQTIHPAIPISVIEVNSATDSKGIGKPTVSVSPDNLVATDPANFPIGEFLMSADIELYKWGFVKVTAITAKITPDEI
jgi:hypothetical protein